MGKHKKLGLITLFFTFLLSGTIVSTKLVSNDNKLTFNASISSYNLTISSLPSTNEFSVSTSSSNNIDFKRDLTYLRNASPLTGLKSISFESSLNEFVISYGWNSTEYMYEEYITSKSFTFDNEPAYFKVSSVSSSNLDISNIVISYSCSKEISEPDISNLLTFTRLNDTDASVKASSVTYPSNTHIAIPRYCYIDSVKYTVTTIESDAFKNKTALIDVDIPSSITSIGDDAFYNTKITNAYLLEGITTLGKQIFRSCTNLVKINIPNSVTSLGIHVGSDCNSLTSINCPKGISELPNYFLYNCPCITTFTILKNITKIGASFQSLSNLSSLIYEGSETEWNKVSLKKTSPYWINNCNGVTGITEFLNK